MSPTTRSDSMKKKVQKREAYSRSAKRSLDNEFEATTSEVQPGLKKSFQFRSTVPVYDDDTGNPITEGVRRIISQTPFADLFDLFFTGKLTVSKSNNQLAIILKGYNHNDDSFSFGGVHVQISLVDVENILGLSASGESITEKRTPASDFVVEAFGVGKTSIKKKDVASAITRELLKNPVRVIDVQERDQNLARLVIIDICIKFLFANGMGSLDMKYVRACEDLNEINKYA